MTTAEEIPLLDLKAQYRGIRNEIDAAMSEVLESAHFILGPQVDLFESEFARHVGVRYAVGVGTGLDAIRYVLVGLGVGPGDEVVLPANSFVASALAVTAAGARPVLVDCLPDTYEIDPNLAEAAISPRTKALLPVHLYGQAADMTAVLDLAHRHGVAVIEDAAQAHGARFSGERCGGLGVAGCFSFYPGKNLGAYGDGGIVVTDDPSLAERVRELRHYGQRKKYDHVVKGGNSRLDTLQAAVLRVKLTHLDDWNAQRRARAARYGELLAGASVGLPAVDARAEHVFHQYVVRSARRDDLQRHLAGLGVQTGIHYPTPIHLLPAYQDLGYSAGSFPVAERCAGEILSLPMFPELSEDQIRRVVEGVRSLPA